MCICFVAFVFIVKLEDEKEDDATQEEKEESKPSLQELKKSDSKSLKRKIDSDQQPKEQTLPSIQPINNTTSTNTAVPVLPAKKAKVCDNFSSCFVFFS
jgi:hypothetical protein